jgi:hypothetical protein
LQEEFPDESMLNVLIAALDPSPRALETYVLMRSQTLYEARWILAELIFSLLLLSPWLKPCVGAGSLILILYPFAFFRDPKRISPSGWSDLRDKLAKGDRFGMIRFASRIKVYLPLAGTLMGKMGGTLTGDRIITAELA